MTTRHWAIIGGVMVAVGSFLPRVAARTRAGTGSVNGVEGAGVGFLVLGVLMALGASRLLKKPGRAWVVVVIGVLVLGLAFFELMDRTSEAIDLILSGAGNYDSLDIGVGFYVVMLGGLLGLTGLAKNPPATEIEANEIEAK